MKQSLGAQALFFPNPVLVVCTYDSEGKPNACTLAWGGIASSGPASIAIAVRPGRYTHDALTRRKAFTANLVPSVYAAEADYFGIASGRDVDKFAVTGLTAVRSSMVDAPYIEEFPYALECVVTHTLALGVHTLFIGEVKDTKGETDMSGRWGSDILTFDAGSGAYRHMGDFAAKAFDAGKKFIEERNITRSSSEKKD